MFFEKLEKSAAEHYAENKASWHDIQRQKTQTRSFGEASYFALKAYSALVNDPICQDYFLVMLGRMDAVDKDPKKHIPKRNHVEKILAIQSAVHTLCQDDSPVREHVHQILTPVYTDSREEYVTAMCRPDFKSPSSVTSFKEWLQVCTDITGNGHLRDVTTLHHISALSVRRSFKRGFTRRV
jgi:hypothetical protein